jgi:hypothetical protein
MFSPLICKNKPKIVIITLDPDPGYRMKGTSSLRCAATGCWTPNELPQCIREDLYGNAIDPYMHSGCYFK